MNNQYYVSKLSFDEDGNFIDSVYVYSYKDGCLVDGCSRTRNWLVNRVNDFDEIKTAFADCSNKWQIGPSFIYENELFRWEKNLPRNIEKRNVFISFYHKDEKYKLALENLLYDLSINQSVHDGQINSNNADDYIRHLIQDNHLKDTTVLIVLIGPNTKNRKHVDWEISGALNYKVGNRYAGVLGLMLPNHPDFGRNRVRHSLLPQRFVVNWKSNYAIVRDWTTDTQKLQNYIEEAFFYRSDDSLIENASIPLKTEDDPDDYDNETGLPI